MQGLYLVCRVSLIDKLLGGNQPLWRQAQLAEERLHFTGGLVDIHDFARSTIRAAPHVRNFARHKNTFAGSELEPFFANVHFKLAFNDVDPLILIVMDMRRSAAESGEFENAHRAVRVLARYFAIVRFAARPAELGRLVESVFAGSDAETGEYFLAFHFAGSFQVLDGFVDRLDQTAGSGEILLQNFSMRAESRNFFEISTPKDALDLLQLESQLAIKENLLERQELRLLVEPVTVFADKSRIQQPGFMVEVKRADANSRYFRNLFDCVTHRFFRGLVHDFWEFEG